ncbi:hypothetical protein [Mesorhizobium sp. A556]
MTKVRLNHTLDCKACGTIQMDIPEGAAEHTEIHCSNCGVVLGEWGALQDDFASQIRDAASIDLNHGTITKQS